MIFLLAAVAAIGILTGDLQLNLYAEQKPGAVIAAAVFTTHLWGWELRSSLENYPYKGSRANNFTVAISMPIFTRRTIPVVFTVEDIAGIQVKRGQRVDIGTVLAYKNPTRVKKLQESLIAYAFSALQDEIQAKLEELTVRSVVQGRIKDIQIQVEEEVIKVTIIVALR